MLKWWNKHNFGNIYASILKVEEEVIGLENIYTSDNCDENKDALDNDTKNFLYGLQNREEAFLKQKDASKYVLEVEGNSKYFHALINIKI